MKQFIILAIILVLSTFIVIIANPNLKEVKITNTTYSVKNKEISAVNNQSVNINNKNVSQQTNIKMNNVPTEIVNKNVNVSNVQTEVKNVKVQPVAQTVPSTPVKVIKEPTITTVKQKPTSQQKPAVQPTQPVTKPKPAAQPVQPKPQTPQQTVQPKPTVQPAQPVQPVAKPKPVVQPAQPTKTAEQIQKEKAAQEAISWNKWRANVHNQIIAQVNLPNVPAGTTFTYSFTVTKDGTISNVKTSSVAPQYTAFAIQYIAPVVRRSAHASFLRFPSGTERTVVDVKYTFRTTNSGSGTQASANNFNDVEVIKK